MITPTIGRKVWFRHNGVKVGAPFGVPQPKVLDSTAPMDATVVYVHSDRKVNLLVVDHIGNTYPVQNVLMLQGDESFTPVEVYCEWMDYQKSQAEKDAAKVA